MEQTFVETVTVRQYGATRLGYIVFVFLVLRRICKVLL
jgi:hypothetical protein